MAVQVNTVLASFRNHIRITTKIWNNHHLELRDIWLSGSPTIRQVKKKAH